MLCCAHYTHITISNQFQSNIQALTELLVDAETETNSITMEEKISTLPDQSTDQTVHSVQTQTSNNLMWMVIS